MPTKQLLRSQISASRTERSDTAREQDRTQIRRQVLVKCRKLALPAGARIACYVPLRTEPGSVELLADLTAAGFEVVVPITLADNDLSWRIWRPQGGLPPGPESLGVAAVTQASLVLVPAFAVDVAGHRLGRGGGSYDRALARVPAGVPVAALLFDGELLDRIPVQEWDRPVSAVVMPSGWRHIERSVGPSAPTGLRNT